MLYQLLILLVLLLIIIVVIVIVIVMNIDRYILLRILEELILISIVKSALIKARLLRRAVLHVYRLNTAAHWRSYLLHIAILTPIIDCLLISIAAGIQFQSA